MFKTPKRKIKKRSAHQIATNPKYALLRKQMRKIEQEQVSITLSQTVDNKQLTDKVSQLRREVGSMSKILDV